MKQNKQEEKEDVEILYFLAKTLWCLFKGGINLRVALVLHIHVAMYVHVQWNLSNPDKLRTISGVHFTNVF